MNKVKRLSGVEILLLNDGVRALNSEDGGIIIIPKEGISLRDILDSEDLSIGGKIMLLDFIKTGEKYYE